MPNQYTTGRASAAPLADRFWAKVDFAPEHHPGCWLWTGATTSFGYGVFMITKGKFEGAHRVVYRLTHGAIPEGLQVLHICDQPNCVKPVHLRVGTQADNIKDMHAKEREARGDALNHRTQVGEANHNAKLSAQQVEIIRSSIERPTVLAKRFGVTYGTIWSIRRRKHWRSQP